MAVAIGFALAVWPAGFDDPGGWTTSSVVLAAFALPFYASIFSAPLWPAVAGLRCLSERPRRSARLFLLAALIAIVFVVQIPAGVLFLAAAVLAAGSAHSAAAPRQTNELRIGHRRVLLGLAAAFFAVPTALLVAGVAAGLDRASEIAVASAYLGVPWLAPGVFVGLARRDVWVGVAAGFASLVVFSVLVVVVLGGADAV